MSYRTRSLAFLALTIATYATITGWPTYMHDPSFWSGVGVTNIVFVSSVLLFGEKR